MSFTKLTRGFAGDSRFLEVFQALSMKYETLQSFQAIKAVDAGMMDIGIQSN